MRDLSGAVAGLRALLMQALHPLAMAGVDQHSDWRRDPVGRLAATTAYVTTVTFGERAAAERAAARVRKIHEHVRGTDTVTGQPYAAGDPALLLWVHAALVDSTLAVSELFGTPAGPGRRRTSTWPRWPSPPSSSACRRARCRAPPARCGRTWPVRPELRCTPGRQRVHGLPARPARPRRRHRRDLAGRRGRRRRRAAGLGPRACTATTAPPLTDARRTEIRQALGVLDAVYLGEPGVLEARQRITLRMRAAQRA